MPYGNLSLAMREALKPIVKGRVVYDLGAGDLDHAKTLLRCGASAIMAIEKDPLPVTLHPSLNITLIESLIASVPVPPDLDVVFLGWPQNYFIPGILTWMKAAKTLIYLGHNFDGTACGFPDMFEHMQERRLDLHIPDARNTLIVVSERLNFPRHSTPEEAAAASDDVVPCPLKRPK